MQRKMRRFKQRLSTEESQEILSSCTNGILSLVDADGAPYGVPISYVYDGADRLYIHSAVCGHKIDCIEAESRCSFCVVERDDIVPEEFTTYFRSVIVTGKIKIAADPEEIRAGLTMLCDKYCPGLDPTDEIDKLFRVVKVLRLEIDSISGKESIELTMRSKK